MSQTSPYAPKVSWSGYVALIVAVIMFSGLAQILAETLGPGFSWLRIFDFNALCGKFGTVYEKATFVGSGGTGARAGFLFALSLLPAIVLALGIVAVVEAHGGLLAAQKLISPVFRPLLGIPGICGLAFITSLQSTDGAAGMTKQLYDSGDITDRERTLFTMLQLSGDGLITNYFSSGAAIFGVLAAINVPIFLPLLVIFICKGIGVNLLRLWLRFSAPETDDAPRA